MIYIIENEYLKARISSIGCTLISLIDKKTNTDVVLGFDKEEDYILYNDQHIGATVGRNANRIGKGRFTVGGKQVQLSINNGPNNLHSGLDDISFRGYKFVSKTDESITFSLTDYDMTGGMPGNLELEIKYSLEDHSLLFEYKGICDKESILNITNHAYFNLNEKGTILSHELKLFTNKVSLNDANGMASKEIVNVSGTAFDFKEYTKIINNMKIGHPNLSNGGLDHNYVFENFDDKLIAGLRNDKLELLISSDLPDVQVYTGNYLGNLKGKGGIEYHDQDGIAIECEFYPNGINYEGIIKPIIKANEEVKHFIRFTLNKRWKNELSRIKSLCWVK